VPGPIDGFIFDLDGTVIWAIPRCRGQQAGMVTGVATREDVARMTSPPDYVLNNLGEIPGIVSGLA
jgi:ribonucleotide monophosphatase NagD (HAD superfamily)